MAKFITNLKNVGLGILAFVAIPYLVWTLWKSVSSMLDETEKVEVEIAQLEGRA
jgi:hypothetical protein